jgi:hypothetical protein
VRPGTINVGKIKKDEELLMVVEEIEEFQSNLAFLLIVAALSFTPDWHSALVDAQNSIGLDSAVHFAMPSYQDPYQGGGGFPAQARVAPPSPVPGTSYQLFAKFFAFLLGTKLAAYSKLAEVARTVLERGEAGALSNGAKLCYGFTLGAVVTSVATPLKALAASRQDVGGLWASESLVLEQTLNIDKMRVGKTSNVDNKSFANFTGFMSNNALSGNLGGAPGSHAYYANRYQSAGDTPLADTFLEDLAVNVPAMSGLQIVENMKKFASQSPTTRFYVNNFVVAGSFLDNIYGNHFCPMSSIADNQPTCSSVKAEKHRGGVEWGIMDVMIEDTNSTISYRLRVDPDTTHKPPAYIEVSAFLKIGNEWLINIASGVARGLVGEEAWPIHLPPNPPLIVPTDGTTPPVDAKVCLRDLVRHMTKVGDDGWGGSTSKPLWPDFIKMLATPPGAAGDAIAQQQRRLIMEIAFRKGTGDNIQELNGLVTNGGYIHEPETVTKDGETIVSPRICRLQLNNDRPSAQRALLLIAFGAGAINPNSMAGYMVKDGKYIVATRSGIGPQKYQIQGGGGRFARKRRPKKRRTRRKPKSKKATKKALLRKRQRRKRTRQNIRKKRNTKGKSRSSRSK